MRVPVNEPGRSLPRDKSVCLRVWRKRNKFALGQKTKSLKEQKFSTLPPIADIARHRHHTHKALPDAAGSTRIGKRLGFGVQSSWQRLIPIVATGLLDCVDPSKIKRVLRHAEFAQRCIAKLCFGQELRLVVLHEWNQPVTTSSAFFFSLIPSG